MYIYRYMLVFVALLGFSFVSPAAAFDKMAYQALIEGVAKEIVVGKFENLDATLKRLDDAIALAKVAAKERAAAHPADAKLMEFSIAAPDAIKKTPVDKLEEDWGEDAKAFERAGLIKGVGSNHFKAAESYADLLVHPTTAWVYLTAWKSAPSAALLEFAKNELVEVLEHLKHAN
jgi:hypothetical protein